MKKLLLYITISIYSSATFALSNSDLTSLKDAVREMCLFPDRSGDYLQTEGEIKAGTPVTIKIVKAELSGKIAYENWNGIPITLDKYKTDPRQCAIEILKILQPALSSTSENDKEGSVQQTTSGKNSPAISNTKGDVNINFSKEGQQ